MRRVIAFAIVTFAALAGPDGAAWAHQEVNPTTFGVGKPIFLTLSSANERQSSLTSIAVASPRGLTIGEATKEPANWRVEHASGRVTWTGSLAPGKFEDWGFEVEPPDQPGTFTFPVTLRYADGRTEEAQVPVTVVQAGAAPTPAPAATGEGAATTIAPTTADDHHDDEAEEAAAPESGGNSANGRANLALGVGAGAMLLGLASLVVAARGPRPAGTDTTDTKEQTW